ncbi:hypothetical protein J4Q44_G00142560 [Coregonus suidteri]|uniref:Uncharacterized protein n=1 Tax=Coregonus suidteri TaxID=861788 RepID=A0AAN8LUT1_9TELE
MNGKTMVLKTSYKHPNMVFNYFLGLLCRGPLEVFVYSQFVSRDVPQDVFRTFLGCCVMVPWRFLSSSRFVSRMSHRTFLGHSWDVVSWSSEGFYLAQMLSRVVSWYHMLSKKIHK